MWSGRYWMVLWMVRVCGFWQGCGKFGGGRLGSWKFGGVMLCFFNFGMWCVMDFCVYLYMRFWCDFAVLLLGVVFFFCKFCGFCVYIVCLWIQLSFFNQLYVVSLKILYILEWVFQILENLFLVFDIIKHNIMFVNIKLLIVRIFSAVKYITFWIVTKNIIFSKTFNLFYNHFCFTDNFCRRIVIKTSKMSSDKVCLIFCFYINIFRSSLI